MTPLVTKKEYILKDELYDFVMFAFIALSPVPSYLIVHLGLSLIHSPDLIVLSPIRETSRTNGFFVLIIHMCNQQYMAGS